MEGFFLASHLAVLAGVLAGVNVNLSNADSLYAVEELSSMGVVPVGGGLGGAAGPEEVELIGDESSSGKSSSIASFELFSAGSVDFICEDCDGLYTS